MEPPWSSDSHSATAAQAKLDLTTAFNDAAGRPGATIVASGELGGLTLAPGVYQSGISSFAITSVDLTLDGGGNANSVWIFQMPSSTLTVGNGRKVILAGGAKASNIFWHGRWAVQPPWGRPRWSKAPSWRTNPSL